VNGKDHAAEQAGRRGGATGAGPAAAAAPSDIEALFAAAFGDHKAGRLAAAEDAYRRILDVAPDHAKTLHCLGVLNHQAGRSAAAVELIAGAIARDGGAPEFHYNLGVVFEALSRLDEAADQYRRTISLNPNHANAHLNLGNVLIAQNKLEEAAAASRRALALNPGAPHAKYNLGIALARSRRFDEAIEQFNEVVRMAPDHAAAHAHLCAACIAAGDIERGALHCRRSLALDPRNHPAAVNLGLACLAQGELKQALELALHAFDFGDSPQARDLFGRTAPQAWAAAEDSRFRALVLRALGEQWLRPRFLMRPALSLVKLNPGMAAAIERLASAQHRSPAKADLFGDAEIAAIANDLVLRALLRVTPLCDAQLEAVLTALRRYLLESATAGAAPAVADDVLAFFCALAEQCFANEYIYALAAGEQERAAALGERLAAAAAGDGDLPPLWVAAVGAYIPLHALRRAERLLNREWPAPVAAVLQRQIAEPNAQGELRASLARLTAVEDATSIAVQRQYEENPYPRWIAAATPGPPESLDAYLAAKFPRVAYKPLAKPRIEILNAGCGTGQHAIETARRFVGADVLAVDLSSASLAYALFKTREIGLTNISYAVADILKLDTLGRSFDVIEAQGVLHHLADPMAAWRLLLAKLRPGGLMSLGLYSAIAREPVTHARAVIAARGYAATADGIRRCRQELAQSDDPLLKAAAERTDFFTVSECRDLLFHVEEHCLTLPQIAAFIAEERLAFLGFDAEAIILKNYEQRFPADRSGTDLASWHRFEIDNPHSFAGMYRFWVQKP